MAFRGKLPDRGPRGPPQIPQIPQVPPAPQAPQHPSAKAYSEAAEAALTQPDLSVDEDAVKESPPRTQHIRNTSEPRPFGEVIDEPSPGSPFLRHTKGRLEDGPRAGGDPRTAQGSPPMADLAKLIGNRSQGEKSGPVDDTKHDGKNGGAGFANAAKDHPPTADDLAKFLGNRSQGGKSEPVDDAKRDGRDAGAGFANAVKDHPPTADLGSLVGNRSQQEGKKEPAGDTRQYSKDAGGNLANTVKDDLARLIGNRSQQEGKKEPNDDTRHEARDAGESYAKMVKDHPPGPHSAVIDGNALVDSHGFKHADRDQTTDEVKSVDKDEVPKSVEETRPPPAENVVEVNANRPTASQKADASAAVPEEVSESQPGVEPTAKHEAAAIPEQKSEPQPGVESENQSVPAISEEKLEAQPVVEPEDHEVAAIAEQKLGAQPVAESTGAQEAATTSEQLSRSQPIVESTENGGFAAIPEQKSDPQRPVDASTENQVSAAVPEQKSESQQPVVESTENHESAAISERVSELQQPVNGSTENQESADIPGQKAELQQPVGASSENHESAAIPEHEAPSQSQPAFESMDTQKSVAIPEQAAPSHSQPIVNSTENYQSAVIAEQESQSQSQPAVDPTENHSPVAIPEQEAPSQSVTNSTENHQSAATQALQESSEQIADSLLQSPAQDSSKQEAGPQSAVEPTEKPKSTARKGLGLPEPEDDHVDDGVMTSFLPGALVYENIKSKSGERSVTIQPSPGDQLSLQQREDKHVPLKRSQTAGSGHSRQSRRASVVSGRRAGDGWSTSAIRWAPLNVPVQRRLQMAAVMFHTLSIATFASLFFALCAIPLLWPILLPYLVYVLFSKAAVNGELRYRSEALRSSKIWSLFGSYFPARIHRTQVLEPTRKYIFGYHPHGIISHGAFAGFATEALGFSQLFPGITNTLLTLDTNFRIPLYRDFALRMGLGSVSRDSCENLLSKGGPNGEGMGRAITIVIGGARESLDATPFYLRLVLKRRKGFVKLAIRTGADLVPVLSFGENDLYDQVSSEEHPIVHKLQMLTKKFLGFTVPLFHARGVFNYDVGIMPYRRPVNIVVGKPIPILQSLTPDPAYVDEIHAQYVDELVNIWEDWKDEFAPDRRAELEILE